MYDIRVLIHRLKIKQLYRRPNLKNLSHGLNLWLDPLKIVFKFLRFNSALNYNRFLADFSHGSNSLNSNTGLPINMKIKDFRQLRATQPWKMKTTFT